MRIEDLPSLPPTLLTAQAAEVWGVGVDHLWKLAREGGAPVEPLRLGHALRWPTVAVLRSVGVEPGVMPDGLGGPLLELLGPTG